MSKNTITFRDKNGSVHTCHQVGSKKIVKMNHTGSLVDTLRSVFNDSSIGPETVVDRINKSNVYIVKSDYNFYFVKPHGNTLEILSDDGFGFHIERGYSYKVRVIGDVIIFWMVDKKTNACIGGYKAVL